MDYEKEYKKLKADIEKAYLFAHTDSTRAVLEHILPELKKSEEERIRKIITLCLEECVHSDIILDYEKDDAITWLEKQGEQKPAEWSEEDEKRLNSCLNVLRPQTLLGNVETINTKWLKSLKERVQPQNHWKPSEGLIKALEKTLIYFQRLNAFGETIDNLKELHQQLNKL